MNPHRLIPDFILFLEKNSSELQNIKNMNSGNEVLISVFKRSFEEWDNRIIGNLQRLVAYFLFEQALDVKDIVEYLHVKVNSLGDTQTVKRESVDKFDEKFGTTTSSIMEQFELPDQLSIDRFLNSSRYHPTPLVIMYRILDNLEIDYRKFNFIDVGSGMGRNLLVASEYPFNKVIGVEISEYLHEIAKSNISLYESKTQKCKDICSYCEDILDFDLPKDNGIILFFWEPFSNEIFKTFLQTIQNFVQVEEKIAYLIFLGNTFPALSEQKTFISRKRFKSPDIALESDYSISIYTNL